MAKKRNYRREYDTYHAKPTQVRRRAARNASRAKLVKTGRVRKGDGKDVHHKDGNPNNKSRKNLAVRTKSANRKKK